MIAFLEILNIFRGSERQEPSEVCVEMQQSMLMIDLDHHRHGSMPAVGLGVYRSYLLLAIAIVGALRGRLLREDEQHTANRQQRGQGHSQAHIHHTFLL